MCTCVKLKKFISILSLCASLPCRISPLCVNTRGTIVDNMSTGESVFQPSTAQYFEA